MHSRCYCGLGPGLSNAAADGSHLALLTLQRMTTTWRTRNECT